jgi:heme-degrading monooxygenase HmoA
VFSLSGFNRAICLATGGACGYAFTNPDADTVYDIFPIQKPPPFAFITVYKVDKDKSHEFEQSWKEVARFHQRQEGYLFTKFLRADAKVKDMGQAQYDYVDIVQWSTGDAQRRATLRTGYRQLIEDMQAHQRSPGTPEANCSPLMYSVVVDDTPSKY